MARNDRRDDRDGRRKKKKGEDEDWLKKQKKKFCQFCKDKSLVDYKDTATLRRYVSDRGKIRARRVTGACTQHQRDIATAVKNARELALLPFSAGGR